MSQYDVLGKSASRLGHFDGGNHGSGFGYMSKGEQRRDDQIPLDARR
jgi:hypothetical protein